MRRKIEFTNDEIYHIYGRGVEKRDIFLDQDDYFRFIHDLYEFNDEELASNLYYKKTALKSYAPGVRKINHERNLLVEVLAFCLLRNHYHLVLRQLKDGCIVRFMQKLGGGYTSYFNRKYNRVGPLFQGRFGAKHVDKEPYFLHLPVYIHLNPLDLYLPEWRARNIGDVGAALKLLKSYRWSSHLDYLGHKNFPSVTSREFILGMLGGTRGYQRAITEWMADRPINLIEEHTIFC